MEENVITGNCVKNTCWINGQWVGTPWLSVFNPATGQEIAKVPDIGKQGALDAVEGAALAFHGWRSETAAARSKN